MADNFLGEIRPVPFNFAPRGWAFCNGQLLSISQNTALFSLLGTFYGGDGRNTFALPNLQARVPVGYGQGLGLSDNELGEQLGADQITLLPDEIPLHTHNLQGRAVSADSRTEAGLLPANAARPVYASAPVSGDYLAHDSVSIIGGNVPHENRQPTLYINYVIALQGIFPARG